MFLKHYLPLVLKKKNVDEEHMVKLEIGSNILLEMMVGKGTELYQKLYEEGLVDDDYSFSYTRQPGYGYAMISSETRNSEELYNRLVNGIEKADKILTEDNFTRVYNKYMGDFVEIFNSFSVTGNQFVDFYFKGVNVFDIFNIINDIDLNYIKSRYIELFTDNLPVQSVIKSK